ncbi:type IV secretory system conjugative DNA transfer family protein [Acidisoma sp. L85]|uniref:type IV secretory system conjugative DNA transfer family protein n=1 Tax=Acidisoma sp. L85 TaxID=1641850 RepID=UPI00131D7F16|nr:type IV secretory system conjugative DNA transfer family protein [Acidisoma sp. L85]
MFKTRSVLYTASVFASLAVGRAGHAAGWVLPEPVPPLPSAAQVDQATQTLGNPLNQPVTGAAETPTVVGGAAPLSLEALQATRPGDQHGDGLKPGRAEELQQAALIYGAQGGLAARAFAINEMLRRYEPVLDTTFDFRSLVLPVGSGQTLLRPPIITQAQLAFALGDGGQVAHETACIYEITREAQLTAAPPNWREYLVRTWAAPQRPADAALPRSAKEVAYWNKWVADGWGQGEKQAVDIFLSDLSRLQRDITGMARYRVLLRSGLVEQPRIAFQNRVVEGGRDTLHVGDQVVRITDQPGLQGRGAGGSGCQ